MLREAGEEQEEEEEEEGAPARPLALSSPPPSPASLLHPHICVNLFIRMLNTHTHSKHSLKKNNTC